MVAFFLKLNNFVWPVGWMDGLFYDRKGFILTSFGFAARTSLFTMDTRNKELHVFVGTIKVWHCDISCARSAPPRPRSACQCRQEKGGQDGDTTAEEVTFCNIEFVYSRKQAARTPCILLCENSHPAPDTTGSRRKHLRENIFNSVFPLFSIQFWWIRNY